MTRVLILLLLPLLALAAMDGWELTVQNPAAGRDCAGDLLAADAMLRRNAAALASTGAGSEIAGVNRLAGDRSGRLSRANYELILRCLAWKDQTKGAVDLLAGPLNRLWGLSEVGEALQGQLAGDSSCQLRSGPAAASPALPGPWPSPAALDSALALARDGGAYFVDLGVLLRSPGMAIDLDPLLDGVLADRAADSLRALGQTGLRLRVGKVWRDDGIGKPWELPLVDPLTRGELGRVELAGRSLALADLTTPALTLEGRPVAELVDPRSGLPAGGADVGVTAAWALADSGEKARAWANTLALLGPEEGLPLLATAPGVEGAVLFSREGRPAWRASAGFPLQSPRGIPAAR